MGATAWFDWAPYHGDPEAALQARRAELFAEGDFVDPTTRPGEYLARKFRRMGLPADDAGVRESIDTANRFEEAIRTGDESQLMREERRVVAFLRFLGVGAAALEKGPPKRTRDRKPATIDELLDALGETGTHGLLDIEHVSPRPRFAHASPLSATMQRKHFGLLEPPFEAVEARWGDVACTLAPGFARWCLTYDSGRPDRVVFIGVTGD